MTKEQEIQTLEAKLAWMKAPDGKKPKVQTFALLYYGDEAWLDVVEPCWNQGEPYRLAPPAIAPGHNPAQLTVDQIPEGRRLFTLEEFNRRSGKRGENQYDIGCWFDFGWDYSGWFGGIQHRTFSVPIDWVDPLLPKPKRPVRKPCGPEHFPHGTIVRGVDWDENTFSEVISRTTCDISILVGSNSMVAQQEYAEMIPDGRLDHMIRSLDNGKTWLPCYVEVEE